MATAAQERDRRSSTAAQIGLPENRPGSVLIMGAAATLEAAILELKRDGLSAGDLFKIVTTIGQATSQIYTAGAIRRTAAGETLIAQRKRKPRNTRKSTVIPAETSTEEETTTVREPELTIALPLPTDIETAGDTPATGNPTLPVGSEEPVLPPVVEATEPEIAAEEISAEMATGMGIMDADQPPIIEEPISDLPDFGYTVPLAGREFTNLGSSLRREDGISHQGQRRRRVVYNAQAAKKPLGPGESPKTRDLLAWRSGSITVWNPNPVATRPEVVDHPTVFGKEHMKLLIYVIGRNQQSQPLIDSPESFWDAIAPNERNRWIVLLPSLKNLSVELIGFLPDLLSSANDSTDSRLVKGLVNKAAKGREATLQQVVDYVKGRSDRLIQIPRAVSAD